MTVLEYFGIYIIGFIITLIILILFGKSKFGIDFDKPKTYANYDDYDSNAEAYIWFSLAWPLLVPLSLLFLSFMGLQMFVEKLIILTNKENE